MLYTLPILAYLIGSISSAILAALSRYSSLAAIVTSAASPLLVAYWLPHPAYLVMSLILAALLLWRHRGNMQRLWRGEEDRIRLSSR